MESYSSYKDSGVEWIQKIPFSWNKSRIRMVGKLYGGLTGKKGNDFNNDDNPFNKPFVPFTNIFNNTYISKNHFQYVNIYEGENQNRVLKYDLFFLMSSESYEDLGKCSILLEDIEELYLNSFCKGYRIKDKRVNPLFLNYQLLGSLHKEMISIEGNGFTRINLRQDRLLDIPLFIPPLNEQTQIVSFLDTKIQKIDELIEKTEQKIKLLKEKQTSLINHCVTKGLNPDVEMKDSGVEWIGEIPSHWNLVSLKYLFEIRKRISGELGYDVLSVTQKGLKVKDLENFKGQHSMDYSKYQLVYKDEFVMNHMDLLTGFVDLSKQTGVTSPDYRVFGKIKDSVSDFYYLYIFQLCYFKKIFYGLGRGVSNLGRWRLPSIEFKFFKLPFPSLSEQTQIVEYLDKQTRKIDSTIEKETQRIELLKEYRQSLISEVVTGKVDVRY
jgi:type I restriction enzyme, S subunit